MRRSANLSLKLAFATACLLVVPLVALAGKPSSGPQVLEGTGGYVETALFDSTQALPVVQASSAVNPVSGSTSMANAENLSLVRGVEVDDLGGVYSIFHANESVTGGSNTFTGIVRYDDTDGIEVVLARSFFHDGTDAEVAQGEYIADMDIVPTLDAGATGSLLAGDIVVSRWADTTDVSDASSPQADDRLEIVLFRPDANGQLVEVQTLLAFDGLYDTLVATRVAVSPNGDLYAWFVEHQTGYAVDTGLYRLSYDANADTYVEEAVTFAFETWPSVEVDEAGNLYVQGSGEYLGFIFQLPAGGDPLLDTAAYATYGRPPAAWSADNAAANGALAAFFLQSSPKLNFVGLIEDGSSVEYADRIAESPWRGVNAMTADASGAVYVAHEDRIQVSKNQYEVAAYTIYRLDPDVSGGGDTDGGGNGNGNGNGKGKNK